MRGDFDTFQTRVGRYFEIAAKTGIVRAMLEVPAVEGCSDALSGQESYLRDLIADLNRYQHDLLVERVIDDPTVDPDLTEAVSAYLEAVAMQASLTAYGAIREYIHYMHGTLGRNQRWGLEQVLYLQSPVLGEFGIGSGEATLEATAERVNAMLARPLMIDQWITRGEFLRADVLMLCRTVKGLNLLVADMSCSSPPMPESLRGCRTPEGLVAALEADIRHMEAKAIFSPATFETSDLSFTLSSQIGTYFRVFSSRDKEPAKVIQSMSYADSFLDALEQHGSPLLPGDWRDKLQVTAMAISGRSIETVNLDPRNRAILRAARMAYRQSKG